MLPKEIDGIKMEDQELDGRFNATIKQYGGVTLDEDEREDLKLQPNFAVYDKIDDLNFMANTEKTFNSLRWNETSAGKTKKEKKVVSKNRRKPHSSTTKRKHSMLQRSNTVISLSGKE